MDDSSSPDDARKSLYEEFLSEVVRAGNPEAFFDEDDLVEIFDFSSDMDNYIAKMEVLLYGARHYPDSQALATRRAWFYSSFGEIEAAAELNSRVSNGGVLNELLGLRALGQASRDTIAERLDKIVDAADDFADEELIQLVDYCAEAGMTDWIEANAGKIRSKSSYPQTFLYEWANRCEDMGDNEKAVSLFEELTMMEPFTIDFWERLAEAQFRADRHEPALQSADYALAIDPASLPALRVKWMSQFALKRDLHQTAQSIEALIAHPELTPTDVSVLVGSLSELGRTDEAVEQLKLYLDTHTPDRSSMGFLMALDPDQARQYLDSVRTALELEGGSFFTWARDEYLEGHIPLASAIADEYLALFPDPSPAETALLTEIYFRNGLFRKAMLLAERRISAGNPEEYLTIPAMGYCLTMSCIRLNLTETALAWAMQALTAHQCAVSPGGSSPIRLTPGRTPVDCHIFAAGYSMLLGWMVRDLSDKTCPIDPDSYLPGRIF